MNEMKRKKICNLQKCPRTGRKRNQNTSELQWAVFSFSKKNFAEIYLCLQSLSQTALHFKSVLSGFTASDRTSLTDWPTDTAPHDPSRYFHSHLAAAGLEEPLGGEGRRKCSSSASTGKGKERESGRGSLGGEGSGRKSLGRESPRGSLGGGVEGIGSGSGRKKRRSGAGV